MVREVCNSGNNDITTGGLFALFGGPWTAQRIKLNKVPILFLSSCS